VKEINKNVEKTNSMDLFEVTKKRVSENALNEIFSEEKRIMRFIELYDFFSKDNHFKFYSRYINSLLKNREMSKVQLEIFFKLLLELDIYKPAAVKIIEQQLFKRNSFWLKFDFVTYLFRNRANINVKKYLSLNQDALKANRNKLLKLQLYINIYVYDKNVEAKIFFLLKHSEYPTPFYLLSNCLIDFNRAETVRKEFVNNISLLIDASNFDLGVKKELSKKFGNV
jgi:hypothetical protein